MRHSSSEDGEQFPMPGDFCFAPDERYENGKLWRDPAVIYDEKAGLYRMVFCAKSAEQPVPNCFGGGIGYAESRDLIQWELKDPLELPEVATSVECPELFPYEDRWALLYFWHDTRFRTAESPLGPWVRGKVLSPDGFNFLAACRLFDGDRQLLFGWISRKDCDCAPYTWGGNMLFPRELTFEEGTPKTRFARELSELFPSKVDQKMISCAGQWNRVDGTVEGCAPIGGALACFEALPERFCLKMTLHFSTDYMTAGIIFGGKPGHSGRENEILDDGWAIDSTGNESTDAERVLNCIIHKEGGGILPLGGSTEDSGSHKGYGWGMVAELFSSIVSLGTTSDQTNVGGKGGICHGFMVIDPKIFGDAEAIKAHLSGYLEALRNSPKAEGHERIYTHGEKEVAAMEDRLKNGIEVNVNTVAEMRDLAQYLEMDVAAYLGEEALSIKGKESLYQ